jgi:hypothetical protein
VEWLVNMRTYLKLIAEGEIAPPKGRSLEEHKDAIEFINTYPDRANSFGRCNEICGFTDEQLKELIAKKLNDPTFGHVDPEQNIDLEKAAISVLSMLRIKLEGLVDLPQLDQDKFKDVIGKILGDPDVLAAFQMIKGALPNINTQYESSNPDKKEENTSILDIILYVTQKTGFYVIDEIDPNKFRTFLETEHHDLFKRAAERIHAHWTGA